MTRRIHNELSAVQEHKAKQVRTAKRLEDALYSLRRERALVAIRTTERDLAFDERDVLAVERDVAVQNEKKAQDERDELLVELGREVPPRRVVEEV
jgi:hypothetical protein